MGLKLNSAKKNCIAEFVAINAFRIRFHYGWTLNCWKIVILNASQFYDISASITCFRRLRHLSQNINCYYHCYGGFARTWHEMGIFIQYVMREWQRTVGRLDGETTSGDIYQQQTYIQSMRAHQRHSTLDCWKRVLFKISVINFICFAKQNKKKLGKKVLFMPIRLAEVHCASQRARFNCSNTHIAIQMHTDIHSATQWNTPAATNGTSEHIQWEPAEVSTVPERHSPVDQGTV